MAVGTYQPPKGVPTFPIGGPTTGSVGPYFTGRLNPARKAWTASEVYAGGKKSPYGIVEPFAPQFSEEFTKWLETQVGAGAEPYSGQAWTPTTGKITQPGQLTAEMNPVLSNLGQFLEQAPYDQSMWVQPKGQQTLDEMIRTGMPISATPEWEAMTSAMDRTYQSGRGDIRTQMAGLGLVGGTPHERAQTDYALQASREKSALIGELGTKAAESARDRQIQGLKLAEQFHALNVDQQKYLLTSAQEVGKLFQGMDQDAINRTVAEFIRTRPEYGPLLDMIYGLSTTFPPTVPLQKGLGAGGAAVAGAGVGASIISNILKIFGVGR